MLKKLNEEDKRAILESKESDTVLAKKYGCSRMLIWRARNPGKALIVDRNRKNKHKAFQTDRKKLKNKTSLKRWKYDIALQTQMNKGKTVAQITDRLTDNLAALMRQRMAIEVKIREVREWQKAVHRFLNPRPKVMHERAVSGYYFGRRPVEKEGMDYREMRWIMLECQLTINIVHKLLGEKYKKATIKGYRNGYITIPKEVAAVLRSYPYIDKLAAEIEADEGGQA